MSDGSLTADNAVLVAETMRGSEPDRAPPDMRRMSGYRVRRARIWQACKARYRRAGQIAFTIEQSQVAGLAGDGQVRRHTPQSARRQAPPTHLSFLWELQTAVSTYQLLRPTARRELAVRPQARHM